MVPDIALQVQINDIIRFFKKARPFLGSDSVYSVEKDHIQSQTVTSPHPHTHVCRKNIAVVINTIVENCELPRKRNRK